MDREADLKMAREIACATQKHANDDWRKYCRDGEYDRDQEVRGALLGILVGRGDLSVEVLSLIA